MTCETVKSPCGCASVIVEVPTVRRPPAVRSTVLGVTMPCSKASAAVNGFMVEPGSKVSVSTRLRIAAGSMWARLFGL